MATKILFVVWDGPQVNYLEGLFYPIFLQLRKEMDLEFHIMQFTWGDSKKTAVLHEISTSFGFYYTHQEVSRRPNALIGSLLTVGKGALVLKKYIKNNQIEIMMPRSTMPAMMVNLIRNGLGNCKIIFDADGLPLEERVDFAGLQKTSFQYKILKNAETKLLKTASAVLTRSQKAVKIHLGTIGKQFAAKFFVVTNGRDVIAFKPDLSNKLLVRAELHIGTTDKVFVYCGSLGKQYGIEEMMFIFLNYQRLQPLSKFLLLTSSPEYLEEKIPREIARNVIIKTVPSSQVPRYLAAADIAFAIRNPTFSMQGINPIKLGEYLLMDLPCIASKGIGDTEIILQECPDCFLFDHEKTDNIELAVEWALQVETEPNKIRNFALQHFALKKSLEGYRNAINYLASN
jgi:hypothetical protein